MLHAKTVIKIFDCHAHIENGLTGYDLAISKRNIIFNDIDSFEQRSVDVPRGDAISLILDLERFDVAAELIRLKRIQALKIHSRVQKIRRKDYQLFHNKLRLVPPGFPVIIDSFYYGSEMDYQPNLDKTAEVIRTFPDLKFVIAHAGGYELLRYFFHLRELKNVWYDLSFSLQYLHDSSAFLDMRKLIRFTDDSRVMFGSDYPYGSPQLQCAILMNLLNELEFTQDQAQRIFFDNAELLFFGENARAGECLE